MAPKRKTPKGCSPTSILKWEGDLTAELMLMVLCGLVRQKEVYVNQPGCGKKNKQVIQKPPYFSLNFYKR